MAEVKLPANSDNVISKETPSTKEPAKERVPVAEPSSKPFKKTSKIGGMFKKEGKDIGSYILNDVVKPTIMDSLYDLGSGALGMLIYKDPNAFRRAKLSRTRGVIGSVLGPARTDYAASSRPRRRDPFIGSPGGIDYANIQISPTTDVLANVNRFDSYAEAYRVRAELLDICLNEHRCTVMDFFKIVKREYEADYTFDNWGWTSLDSSYITRVGDIYTIELPRPRQIR
jgi:hypothetical protein